MNILFITNYFYPAIEWGGPIFCSLILAEGLINLGHNLNVITTNSRGKGFRSMPSGDQIVHGIPVSYTKFSGPSRYFYSKEFINEITKRIRSVDIVHINGLWTYPTFIASRLARQYHKPYIITLHGSLIKWAMKQNSLKKFLYFYLIENKTIRESSLIHFTSNYEKRESILISKNISYAIIPNPIEVEKFLRIDQLQNRKSEYTLLILGRLHRVKGFDILLPAIRNILHQHKIRLIIAGHDENGYLTEIQRMITNLDLEEFVKYKGTIFGDELINTIRESDIVVQPSYQENFGLSSAEAMASARPVIVTRNVGISEHVEKADCGFVVEPKINELENGILSLISNWELMVLKGSNGRSYAKQYLSRDAVINQMSALYQTLVY